MQALYPNLFAENAFLDVPLEDEPLVLSNQVDFCSKQPDYNTKQPDFYYHEKAPEAKKKVEDLQAVLARAKADLEQVKQKKKRQEEIEANAPKP